MGGRGASSGDLNDGIGREIVSTKDKSIWYNYVNNK